MQMWCAHDVHIWHLGPRRAREFFAMIVVKTNYWAVLCNGSSSSSSNSIDNVYSHKNDSAEW